jgi:hypothetical protein
MGIAAKHVSVIVVASAALALAISCGGSDNEGDGDGDGSGSGGSPTLNPNGPNGIDSNPEACQPSADESGCIGVAYEGESIDTDILVMFDVSCSMSCSIEDSGCCIQDGVEEYPRDEQRITPVRAAMTNFLTDPASAGIGVGLAYFGDHDLDQNNDPNVCSVEGHSDASVEIAPLPDNADALVASLDAKMPQGGTPTHLAIEGACAHVSEWKTTHPDNKTVVLLVTDGIPEYSCNANINRAVAAAEQCRAETGTPIYVLGVDSNNNGINNSLVQLDQIAEAGGTNEAYITDNADVEGSMLAALNAIRADAVIPCDLRIPDPPPGETMNPGLINLGICDAGGTLQTTPNVVDEGACDGNPGWYYDDPTQPEMIHLCEATCETVSVPGATLFYTIGCETQIVR